MKIPFSLFLGLVLATVAHAQSDLKPPQPLSAATQKKVAAMKSMFDGKTLGGWVCEPGAWEVKDRVMASTGTGRGVIYSKENFGSFRLVFQVRHVSGQPDHQAGVLIFCEAPQEGPKAPDVLRSVQFQVPNGGHWDYRIGHNNAGTNYFTKVPHPKFDAHEWSQVEILADAKTGIARMAVAQPVGTKAVEVLDFKDEAAGRSGPIAWQMHNKGLFDEYKDVRIEVDPNEPDLITVK